MATHVDPNDPGIALRATAILERHERGEAEANITSAVRDFLIATGLARAEEIVEEKHPALGARSAVDLTALDTFIECKIRVGTGIEPDPGNIEQLDGYLAESEKQGRVRMGVLTDGKHWLLRWPGAGPASTAYPYAFTLEEAGRWIALYEWLRDHALSAEENKVPDRETVGEHFGPNSPAYRRDITALKALYAEHAGLPTIQVKRRLWRDLLRAALGEAARSDEEWDDLFVRHTYLSAVVGVVVQASFGIDIYALADADPDDLLQGRQFRDKTGVPGVVESDFFAWPIEVGGRPLLRNLARRAAKFDWQKAPNDIAAILYETVIPPAERRQLGEYYTPDWLARAIVGELVTDPLNQRVLDPACGSGTFIAEAVAHFLDGAKREGRQLAEMASTLREAVTGIDVHPVAVHLARAAWVLAAKPAIEAAGKTGMSAPIYLGDALQLRFRTGDLFLEHEVTIQVEDGEKTELVFPVSLVERADNFDALMVGVAEYLNTGEHPRWALNDNHISDPQERAVLEKTIDTLARLHAEGRDHIWAYYTRNMVRPVALSRAKVDVIVGNPPWINYNQTADALRVELERRSKDEYGIWTGGRYATHQDVAGLFFARAVDLYLKDDGVIGMVMPHSALQAGQYAKWRTGRWRAAAGTDIAVDFGHKTAWDLEKLEPNTFFPIASSVAFARRTPRGGKPTPLVGEVERWRGKTGADDVRRERVPIVDTSAAGASPYAAHARQGATIVPRRFFFVEETENPTIIQVEPIVMTNPRRSSQDKAPWNAIDLTAITGEAIEPAHLFDVHLGETVAPYAALDPLKAVLPLVRGNHQFPANGTDRTGGIDREQLKYRMRRRWRIVSELWEAHKSSVNKLDLLGRLDYHKELSSQLEWQQNPGDKPIRLAYNQSGAPTAALLDDDDALVDYTLYWIACKDVREAHYLLAIINSDALYEAVAPMMAKGQFGARHLQKHLWKLAISEFDAANPDHGAVADAGEAAARGATTRLAALRAERGDVTVTVVRRKLREWLRESAEGKAVEEAVSALLGG